MSQPATLPSGIAALTKAPGPGAGTIPTAATGTSSARRGILRRFGGMPAGVGAGNSSVAVSFVVGSGSSIVAEEAIEVAAGVGVKVGGNSPRAGDGSD